MFEIRERDKSEAEYLGIAAVETAVYPENASTVADFKHTDANWDTNYLRRLYVVDWGGEIVAFAGFSERPWSYVPGVYSLGITVHPDFEGRGIGTAVYDRMLQSMNQHEHKLVRLHSHSYSHKPQSVRFLEKLGFEAVMRWIVSVLDVTNFDGAKFAGLKQKIAESGIEIRPLSAQRQLDPDCLHNLYELDWELTLDEPQPTKPTKQPFEKYVKQVVENPNSIEDGWFLAVENGRYVGMSYLEKNEANPKQLRTGFTGTVRSHRRRGLATALKCYAIEYAQQQGFHSIRTGNEENNPMYALNVQLGFEDLTSEMAFVKNFGGE